MVLGFRDLLRRGIACQPACGVTAGQDQPAHPFGMPSRIAERGCASCGGAEQDEAIQLVGINDGLQVLDRLVECERDTVAIR